MPWLPGRFWLWKISPSSPDSYMNQASLPVSHLQAPHLWAARVTSVLELGRGQGLFIHSFICLLLWVHSAPPEQRPGWRVRRTKHCLRNLDTFQGGPLCGLVWIYPVQSWWPSVRLTSVKRQRHKIPACKEWCWLDQGWTDQTFSPKEAELETEKVLFVTEQKVKIYVRQKQRWIIYVSLRASQVALMVKNLPASAGDIRDMGSVLGSGRSPEEGNSNLLQYSFWETLWTEDPGGLWSIGLSFLGLEGQSTSTIKPCFPLCVSYSVM